MNFSILILVFTTLIIGVGCSTGSDGSLFGEINSKSCLDSKDEVCFSENRDFLSLDSSVRNIKLKPNQVNFNLGGECNEGGFPLNRIDWHIMSEAGAEVIVNSLGKTQPETVCGDVQSLYRNSQGASDGLGNAPGTCVSGRYNLKINLPMPLTKSYVLFMCITGYNSDTQYNMSGSTLNISLEP